MFEQVSKIELVMQKLSQSNDLGERLVRHFAAFGFICMGFLIGKLIAKLIIDFRNLK